MRLNAELQIAKVVVSRKNTGASQGPLSMYLLLKGDVSVEQMESMFPTQASYVAELADRWDDFEELRHGLVNELELEGIKGVGVRFEIVPAFGEKMVFQTSDVDKVIVGLKAGRRVDLSLRVLVTPTDAQIAPVITWLGNVMDCDLWSRQAELELDDEAGDETERRRKLEAQGRDPTAVPPVAAGAGSKVQDGDSLVPGQKPPQRPKARKPAGAGVH